LYKSIVAFFVLGLPSGSHRSSSPGLMGVEGFSRFELNFFTSDFRDANSFSFASSSFEGGTYSTFLRFFCLGFGGVTSSDLSSRLDFSRSFSLRSRSASSRCRFFNFVRFGGDSDRALVTSLLRFRLRSLRGLASYVTVRFSFFFFFFFFGFNLATRSPSSSKSSTTIFILSIIAK